MCEPGLLNCSYAGHVLTSQSQPRAGHLNVEARLKFPCTWTVETSRECLPKQSTGHASRPMYAIVEFNYLNNI